MLLLIWVSMKDDVFNAYAKTGYAIPVWSVVTY